MGYDNAMRADAMIEIGLFDDIPYKWVKYYNINNNPIIAVAIEDIGFNMFGIFKTQFTFELSSELSVKKFTHIIEYEMNTYMADTIKALNDEYDDDDRLSMAGTEIAEEDEDEEEEDEEEEED